VTKVWATYTTRVELGLEKSLQKLGLDYVDLFLVVSTYLLMVGVWIGWLTKNIALAAVDESRG
jgi:diketogulonate reductase-like aldo/keto reductase